jgi:hypothetical protein
MIDPIKRFAAELRADEGMAPFADRLERELRVLDREADVNDDEAQRFSAIEWIVNQPAPLFERILVLGRLFKLEGRVCIHMPTFFSETLQQVRMN